MLQPLQLQEVATRYPQQIAELQDFLAMTGLRLQAADTLADMATRLRQDRAFRRDLISHVWVVIHLSGGEISYSSLLGVLALAAAGPHFAADAEQTDAHELLRFLMEARRSFETSEISESARAVPVAENIEEAWTEPQPPRPPFGPAGLSSILPAARRFAFPHDGEPETMGNRRIVWVAAACLLLAASLGLWWHARSSRREPVPATTAHATPADAPSPPTETADLHAAARGSASTDDTAPAARSTAPSPTPELTKPAKPSPLVLHEILPRARSGRASAAAAPVTSSAPVTTHPPAAPALASSSEASAPRPNPVPRSRTAAAVPRPQPVPNLRAESVPPNGGSGTADVPRGGYVRPTSLGIMAANVMYSPVPQYPPAASAAHVQGEVRLEAEVDRDGNVAATRVISGPPLLRNAAIDALQQWRYRPYLYDGKPVPVNTVVVMDFRLQ